MVDIDEIEADGGVAYARLAGSGIADVGVFPLHDFRPAVPVNADNLVHGFIRRDDGEDTLEQTVVDEGTPAPDQSPAPDV